MLCSTYTCHGLCAAKWHLVLTPVKRIITVDSTANREMYVYHTRPTSLYETSVVDKLLLMLFISVLLLASTPCVQSQSMTSQCFRLYSFIARM